MKRVFIYMGLLLTLVIGFTSCTTSYYVTGQGSPNRHQGYKRDYDQRDRYYDPYRRGNWRYNDGYRYGGNGNWRYRRW